MRPHGGDRRGSDGIAASIRRDAEIAQPQAPLARVRLELAAEQGIADDPGIVLGDEAFEPSVGTEAAFQQGSGIGARIGIVYVRRELSRQRGDRRHVGRRGLAYFHAG